MLSIRRAMFPLLCAARPAKRFVDRLSSALGLVVNAASRLWMCCGPVLGRSIGRPSPRFPLARRWQAPQRGEVGMFDIQSRRAPHRTRNRKSGQEITCLLLALWAQNRRTQLLGFLPTGNFGAPRLHSYANCGPLKRHASEAEGTPTPRKAWPQILAFARASLSRQACTPFCRKAAFSAASNASWRRARRRLTSLSPSRGNRAGVSAGNRLRPTRGPEVQSTSVQLMQGYALGSCAGSGHAP